MSFKDLILDTIYPKKCIICNKDDTFLCLDCLQNIKIKTKQKCIVCGKKNNCGKLCPECSNRFYFQYSVIATNFKNKDVSIIIKTFKYRFVSELGKNIGLIMFTLINDLQEKEVEFKEFLDTKPLIMFVPLHKKRLNWRGFNQAQIIAEYLSEKMNLNVNYSLSREKNSKTQTNLEKEDRLQNAKDIFACNADLNKKNIILVDDVITTGATVKYASKSLKQANAGKIMTLAFAGE